MKNKPITKPQPVTFSISKYLNRKKLQLNLEQHSIVTSQDHELKIHVWGTQSNDFTLTLEERERRFNSWKAHEEDYSTTLRFQKIKIDNYDKLANGSPL